MTFWGDMLLPFGGKIWLGSLIRAMAPFGFDKQLVRTSVHRLVAEGWLTAETHGRRRELSMPAPRLEELRRVQSHMYRTIPRKWAGRWSIVVVSPNNPALRETLRREFRWQGYAMLAPNTFIHPSQDWLELSNRLAARNLVDMVSHFFVAESVIDNRSPLELWSLEEIGSGWRDLVNLLDQASKLTDQDAETAYVVRLLLVHELRISVLRDPRLPGDFLPHDWPEKVARRRFKEFYASFSPNAYGYLSEIVLRADGSVPEFEFSEDAWRFQDNIVEETKQAVHGDATGSSKPVCLAPDPTHKF
jgi:phenylacetic acid degradation operon negative regulatory protein